MNRVEIQPALLQWARERAGKSVGTLIQRFPKLQAWESGETRPTLKQLELYAKATHTPIGFLFLQAPPLETIPIPDFRTVANAHIGHPSADLLDTIYLCQQRQDWYRQHAQLMGDPPLAFIGSVKVTDNVVTAATVIRAALALDTEPITQARDTEEAFRILLDRADELGVLVMVNGVVRSNTRRKLDPDEFRGFALADPLAPLIFVNGADTKAARMFTLVHEIAHLYLGESGVSDVTPASAPRGAVERWCNAVAAEVLAPLAEFKKVLSLSAELWTETKRLSAIFRVSTLVVLRRMRDAGRLTGEEHVAAYEQESARLREFMQARKEAGGGGNFYNMATYRLSARFAGAVIASTWEGRSTFTEAFRLLECRSVKTLENIGRHLRLVNPTTWEAR